MARPTSNPPPAGSPPIPKWEYFAAGILGLTLFLAPLSPDEKLNRLKLVALGSGFLLSAFFWALSKAAVRQWRFYRTPVDPFLAVYSFSAILYYFFSDNRSVAASELERMVFSVGAFIAAVQTCSGENGTVLRRVVFSGWAAGAALSASYGILQRTGGAGRIQVPQMDRVFSTFGNPIFFAAFLIITLPWMAAMLLEYRRPAVRAPLLIAVLLSAVALFFTRTRAAFLSLPVACFVFFVLLEYWRGWVWVKALRTRKKAIAVFLVALAAAHFILHAAIPSYRRAIAASVQEIHASRLTSAKETHTVIWKDVLRMWRAHPLFGTGYGTFHIEFPQYASDELKRIFPQRERIVNDAHNEYLQILAETGIVGFAIFMLVLIFFYRHAFLYFKKTIHLEGKDAASAGKEIWIYCGLLIGISSLLFQNIFSVDMRFIVSSAYVFLGMGLCLSHFSESAAFAWPGGAPGKAARSLCVIAAAAVIGIAGISPADQSFYVLGVYRLKNEGGQWKWTQTPAQGPGLFPALIRPYLSQKVLARTPDFFDEKLLNSAQTIRELEDLTAKYPDQWRYWEKLGYAYAKEIQSVDPSGKKVIHPGAVQKAVAAYERAHRLNPSAEGPPNNLGNIYFTIHRRSEAIEWWRKGIESNPDKIDARLNLGLCYYYEGRIKESAVQFQEVLKRDPRNEKAIVMLKRMVE